MSKKLVIAHMPIRRKDALVTVLYEDGQAVDLSLANPAEGMLLGGVYLGRVESVKESLGAAFVRFGDELNGYLPLDRSEQYLRTGLRKEGPLAVGDELIVQVSREPMRGKLPRLTSQLALPGTWLVLTTESLGLRFSGRLADADRAALYETLREVDRSAGYGLILRTNAPEASAAELRAEYEELSRTLEEILRDGQTRRAPACLYANTEPSADLVAALPRHEAVELVTDDAETYAFFEKEFLHDTAEETGWQLRRYEDATLPLYKLYEMEKLLADATAKRVWLPSGAYLVIEQTEAFVSVDVNSGKNDRARPSGELFAEINREAVKETARQLRLRQLSGTILIDCINLKEAVRRRELLSFAEECFRADPVRTTAVDITPIGILEVTRQKVRRSLAEQIANREEAADDIRE